MGKNNENFYKKRIMALEKEESRLRRINDDLAQALKIFAIHSHDKDTCEVCKLLSQCGY